MISFGFFGSQHTAPTPPSLRPRADPWDPIWYRVAGVGPLSLLTSTGHCLSCLKVSFGTPVPLYSTSATIVSRDGIS